MRKMTIALLASAAIIAGACGASGDDDVAGPGAQDVADAVAGAGKKKTIVMEVSGPKKASVTYGLNADQSQDSSATLPWKKTMTSSEVMTIVVLSAQNAGSGTITCKITVDGKVVKTNKSTGEYSVVTCSADNL